MKRTYYAEHRRIFNGLLHRHVMGWAWRDLPERYGPWSAVASRQRRRTREGLLHRIFEALQRELAERGRIEWELWCVDGSAIGAHKAAAGAGQYRPGTVGGASADHALGCSRGGFTSELHLITDRHGFPVAATMCAGKAHESQYVEPVLRAVRIRPRTPGRPRSRSQQLGAARRMMCHACARCTALGASAP